MAYSKYTLLFLSLFFPLFLHSQPTWYVRASAPDGGDGTSWANAFNDLHSALDVAQKGHAVWVAAGQYVPDKGSNRNRAFAAKSGVQLLGGFAGTESSAAERRRQPAAETVLSGNIGNPADSTDNAYTILYLDHPDTTTLIDGFTFRHGYALSDTSFDNTMPTRSGAAVFVNADNGVGMPVFVHCVFRDNAAFGSGAGVFVRANKTQGSTPLFRDCVFFNNYCGYSGGAVHLNGGAATDRGIEFLRCTFLYNRSVRFTGGVHIEKTFGGDVIDFKDCHAERHESALGGGFLYYRMEEAKVPLAGVRINKCSFVNNKVNFNGSSWSNIIHISIYNFIQPSLKGTFIMANSTVVKQLAGIAQKHIKVSINTGTNQDTILFYNNRIENNIIDGEFMSLTTSYNDKNKSIVHIYANMFKNNIKTDDPTIYSNLVHCNNAIIENNVFMKNSMSLIYIFGSSYLPHRIQNNLFINNNVPANKNSNISSLIDRVNSKDNVVLLLNNLFLRNRVWNAYKAPVGFFDRSELRLFAYNNIFSGNINLVDNTPTIPLSIGFDTLLLSHNLLDMDCSDLPVRTTRCQAGNLYHSTPLFADTSAGRYALAPCSPGIDAGLDSILQKYGILTDTEGHPRRQDGRSDMGPYEAPPYPIVSRATSTATCPGTASGRIEVSLLQGCPPFRLQWSGGSSDTGAIAGLAAGAYELTLTDQRGQKSDFLVFVQAHPDISATAQVQDAKAGQANGRIAVAVSGGTPPLSYRWNTADTTAVLDSIAAGRYDLTLTDGAGCTAAFSWEVRSVSAIETPEAATALLSFYPNPAHTTVTFEVKSTTVLPAARLVVTDIRGRNVYVQPLTATAVLQAEVATWPSGVYGVYVENEGRRVWAGILMVE